MSSIACVLLLSQVDKDIELGLAALIHNILTAEVRSRYHANIMIDWKHGVAAKSVITTFVQEVLSLRLWTSDTTGLQL